MASSNDIKDTIEGKGQDSGGPHIPIYKFCATSLCNQRQWTRSIGRRWRAMKIRDEEDAVLGDRVRDTGVTLRHRV